MAAKKESDDDRIGKMVEERMSSFFESRERKEKEASDPWARIEGIIDRTVGKYFDGLNKGLEEGERKEKGEKPEDDEGPITALFGARRK